MSEVPKEELLSAGDLIEGLDNLSAASSERFVIADKLSLAIIVKNIALKLADKATGQDHGEHKEMSLDMLKASMKDVLGEELFENAEGHAEANLNWYREGMLDLKLTTAQLSKEVQNGLHEASVKELAKDDMNSLICASGSGATVLNVASDTIVEKEDKADDDQLTAIDFSDTVKNVIQLHRYPYHFTRGYFEVMNDILFNVTNKLIDESVKFSEDKKDDVLEIQHVVKAVQNTLSGELQTHAVARIMQEKDEMLRRERYQSNDTTSSTSGTLIKETSTDNEPLAGVNTDLQSQLED